MVGMYPARFESSSGHHCGTQLGILIVKLAARSSGENLIACMNHSNGVNYGSINAKELRCRMGLRTVDGTYDTRRDSHDVGGQKTGDVIVNCTRT